MRAAVMKSIIVRCMPDHAAVRALIDDEALNGACHWMRVELPALALEELQDLVSYYHSAPQEVITIAARLSMVVTVFAEDVNPPALDVTILDGCSCSLTPSRVAPSTQSPWEIIAATPLS